MRRCTCATQRRVREMAQPWIQPRALHPPFSLPPSSEPPRGSPVRWTWGSIVRTNPSARTPGALCRNRLNRRCGTAFRIPRTALPPTGKSSAMAATGSGRSLQPRVGAAGSSPPGAAPPRTRRSELSPAVPLPATRRGRRPRRAQVRRPSPMLSHGVRSTPLRQVCKQPFQASVSHGRNSSSRRSPCCRRSSSAPSFGRTWNRVAPDSRPACTQPVVASLGLR